MAGYLSKKKLEKTMSEFLTYLRPHFRRQLPLGCFRITPHQIWPDKSTDEISLQLRPATSVSGTNITLDEIKKKIPRM